MTKIKVVFLQSAVFMVGVSSSVARSSDYQQLSGHIPQEVQGLAPTGRLGATNRLSLALSLPLRNANQLNQLLRDLYDPSSPNFRHYLTSEEFTRRFGPTAVDYATVQAYCQSNGLAIKATHPNRTVLDVIGPVSAIESALRTTLREYPHPTENRTFYAPEAEPSVALAIPILHVTGLDNLHRPRPLSKRAGVDKANRFTPNAGSGKSGSFFGKDFRAAYAPGVSLTGSGQTLALLEMDGYYPNDIATYERLANIPAVPVQVVSVDKFNEQPGPGNGEVALDIQMAISMAPGLKEILVYEESTNSLAIDVLNKIATDNLAKQISSSWTWGTYDPGTDQAFLEYAAQGQSFFQASGDLGAYLGPIDAPADNPYITVVGGTTLSTSQSAWAAETAWNDQQGDATGGGYSTIYPIPAWQSGVNMDANFGSTIQRNIPDVAMIADNVESISDNGQIYQVIGTSIAAPLWAAFTALANEQAAANGQPSLGFLNPTLYSIGLGGDYLTGFHDIGSGNNSAGGGAGFPAVANYDLCTGWGSPAGSNTISLLLKTAHGQIDHFTWSSVQTPVTAGTPFAVTLTSQTAANATAKTFNGTPNLSAVQIQTNSLFNRDFETGTLSDWVNEGTYNYSIDTTTGAAGTKQSLTLIGGDSNTSYDGISHTLANLSPDMVEFYVKTTDNTLTSAYFVAGQSAFRANSVFHFRMDGSGSMGLTDGPGNFYGIPFSANQWYRIDLALNWGTRTVDYYVDGSLAMPNIPFCNTNLTSLAVLNIYNFDNTQAWYDQISMTKAVRTVLPANPAVTGAFTNGVWVGAVSLSQSGTNIALIAADEAGHTGASNPFDVQAAAVSLPPQIVTQPANQIVAPGASATFSVIAAGTDPLSYLWQRNGIAIASATDSSYTLAQASATESGSLFNCLVRDAGGTVASQNAALIVQPVFEANALRVAGNLTTITFNGTSGSNYVVQFSTDLKMWTALTTIQASGGIASVVDTTTSPRRFYRIQGTP